MTGKPFGWCFIGTGTLARQVAAEIAASGRHRVKTVCSRVYEKAAAFAETYGGTAYADPDEAIRGADGVYVVTPHPSHYEYVKRAIALGKPVLCEKPMTVRAEETRELFALAKERGVYLVEGMWTWFAPTALKVREWLEAGAVGEIREVTTRYRGYVVAYAPRLTDPLLAGGALLDSGVYPVTYLYRLFGRPTAVKCEGRIENGVDLADEIDLTFADGRTRHITLAIDDRNGAEDIRLTGDRGGIYVDRFHCAARAERLNPDGTVAEVCEGRTTMLNEFDRVADEIRAGRTESAWIPPEATIDVMEILDECRRQIGLVYPFETRPL